MTKPAGERSLRDDLEFIASFANQDLTQNAPERLDSATRAILRFLYW